MTYPGEKAFEVFEKKYGADAGTEVMERIADAMWDQKGNDRLIISNIHTINACNHVVDGDIEHAGEWFSFSIESGDRNGTVIHGWGPLDEVSPYKPEPPVIYEMVPRDRDLELRNPSMFRVYLHWRDADWFKEMCRSYNYDRYAQPGGKIEGYYRDKAAKRGLAWTTREDAKERIDAFRSISA
ncbi:hypothetical protein [Komagataeibacter diospyri]|uniref:Uncharacterized protein n=1 Tax=Komagataeibacter diospyri TaxID=1932662 RepID=A0A4P5NZN5_9PROT|nr:hypothetical protein [Komagataeibacter diospyri]GCE85125.1 hypothetical protein MSKU9_3266 [Komagataeibacter diospyri]